MEFVAIILGAGDGKRMNSSLPKPLHRLGGKPMLGWAIDALELGGATHQIVITPKDNTALRDFIEPYKEQRGINITLVQQNTSAGTGDAVAVARKALKNHEGIGIITCADTPLISADTFQALERALNKNGAAIACLGFDADDPSGYGRLVVDEAGILSRIVEDSDANQSEAKITFVNAGTMAVRLPMVFDLLDKVGTDNAQGEKYLTDIVGVARDAGHDVVAVKAAQGEALGINNRQDLAVAEAMLQTKLRNAAAESGATLIAPETVFLHYDTVLCPDVVIEPHVVFGAGVVIGSGTTIKSFSHLEGVTTGACCVIGPYARLRPGTILDEGVKIGNFVETKNTHMGHLSKASHLSYLGDTTIGEKTNIGAGTITCNYDGFAKHKTHIGSEAFIGSNTALIAPISVGDRAIIAAGSTIAEDIPPDTLAIGRSGKEVVKKSAKTFRKSRE